MMDVTKMNNSLCDYVHDLTIPVKYYIYNGVVTGESTCRQIQ